MSQWKPAAQPRVGTGQVWGGCKLICTPIPPASVSISRTWRST